MRLFRDPVWRGSLVVLLRHYAAYAVALAFGSAALAVSVLSGRTFLDAADVALVRSQVDAVPATAAAEEQGRVRAAVSDGSPARVEAAVSAAMDGLEGGGPTQVIRQPVHYLDPRLKAAPYVVNPATGDRTPGVVFEATGALDALVPAAGSPEPGGDGLWLPDTLATRLHLTAGDPVGLQLALPGGDPAPAMATVAGVYATDPDGVPEDPTGLWGRIIDQLPGWPSHVEPTAPQLPLLVADTDTYRALVAGVGEVSLVTWDVAPDANPVRLADLERLNGSVEVLRDELSDPASDLSKQLTHRGRMRVTLSTGLPDMMVGTRAGLRATRDGVAAVRVLAAGLSWLVVALAAVALLVRRRGPVDRCVLLAHERAVLEERDEVVRHVRDRVPQRLREDDAAEREARRHAERERRLELRLRHGLDAPRGTPPPRTRRSSSRADDDGRGERAELQHRREAVVEEVELQEHGRAAVDLDVGAARAGARQRTAVHPREREAASPSGIASAIASVETKSVISRALQEEDDVPGAERRRRRRRPEHLSPDPRSTTMSQRACRSFQSWLPLEDPLELAARGDRSRARRRPPPSRSGSAGRTAIE